MANDINIRVTTQSVETQKTTENTPTIETSATNNGGDRTRQVKTLAVGAVAISSARRISNTLLNRAGEITDDPRLQRNIDKFQNFASLALPFAVSPLLGTANLLVRGVTNEIDRSLNLRNARRAAKNLESTYTGNIINGGRLDGDVR